MLNNYRSRSKQRLTGVHPYSLNDLLKQWQKLKFQQGEILLEKKHSIETTAKKVEIPTRTDFASNTIY